MRPSLEQIAAVVRRDKLVRPVGRITGLEAGLVQASGLSCRAALGDRVRLGPDQALGGEILRMDVGGVSILPEGPGNGLQLQQPVILDGPAEIAPDDGWVGRVIDPQGRPLDHRPLLPGAETRRLHGQPVNPTERRALGPRMETGMAVFNTLLPIVRGQRLGLFAGSGVGKSTLLAQLSQGVQADVIVIALVGERNREVLEFVERVLGPRGMKKTILVVATSDRPPALRRRCPHAAMAVAEHFRDQGKQVLLLVDSVTRLADAHREIAIAGGELPSLHGYPPSTMSMIAGLCERAGPGCEGEGDITALFTVLVAGSDMEEPLADTLRGLLDGHVVLDRSIAERGRFPAIDVVRSVSRSLPEAASDAENVLIAEARRLLGAYDRSELMIRSGLYTPGADPLLDKAVEAWPRLDAFAARSEAGSATDSFLTLAACLHKGGGATGREGQPQSPASRNAPRASSASGSGRAQADGRPHEGQDTTAVSSRGTGHDVE